MTKLTRSALDKIENELNDEVQECLDDLDLWFESDYNSYDELDWRNDFYDGDY